jgi:hypothetical protein
MKNSPSVLDFKCSEALQMMRRQEGARCGSVESNEVANGRLSGFPATKITEVKKMIDPTTAAS